MKPIYTSGAKAKMNQQQQDKNIISRQIVALDSAVV